MESDISTARASSTQNQVPLSGCIRDSDTDEGRTREETAIESPITGDDAENGIIPAEFIILLSSTYTSPTRATESGATSVELSDEAHTPEGSTDETAGGCIATDVEPRFVTASSTVILTRLSLIMIHLVLWRVQKVVHAGVLSLIKPTKPRNGLMPVVT